MLLPPPLSLLVRDQVLCTAEMRHYATLDVALNNCNGSGPSIGSKYLVQLYEYPLQSLNQRIRYPPLSSGAGVRTQIRTFIMGLEASKRIETNNLSAVVGKSLLQYRWQSASEVSI